MTQDSSLPVPVAPRIRIELARTAPVPDPRPARGWRLPMAVAVVGAIGASLALIPRGQEMALLRLESGDAAGARALLEQRFAAGEQSPAIVAALARARAETGDLPAAVALLEPLAAERPRDRQVLEALVNYRRQLGDDRPGLLRALLALQVIAPDVSRLREIAGLQGLLGQREAQRDTLRALLSDSAAQPGDLLALARLEAAGGSPAEGLAALRRLARNHPAAYDVHAAALAVSLQVDAGQPEAAASVARDWLASQPRGAAAAAAPMLASFLAAARRPDLAVLVLEPLAGVAAPPALVLALAQAEIDARREREALTRLELLAADAGGVAAMEAATLRLRLAVALGETARAIAAVEAIPRGQASSGVLATLAGVALDAGQTGVLRRLLAWGGPDLLEDDPGLAAEVALQVGDRVSARRWAQLALAARRDPAEPRRALGFAGVLMALGHPDPATDMLARISARPELPSGLLAEVARSFVRMEQAEQGAALFEALRTQRPSPALDAAWLLTAAALPDRQEAAVAWIASDLGAAAPRVVLRDAMHVAMDAGVHGTAIAAARRLAAEGGTEERRLLARLLLDADRPAEALQVLRALAADGGTEPNLMEAARHGAWRQGDAAAARELRAIWSSRLTSAATDAERGAALAMLRELGARNEMLPALHAMARSDPEAWLWAYTEAADGAGQAREATRLWAELAQDPARSVAMRRQLAFGLIERGARAQAEPVFRALAATAGPDSAEVRQLLFAWGQRPNAAALSWLEARARGATDGTEKAAWMRLLTERGGARNAVAAYRASGGGGTQGPAREAYLTALAVAGDRGGLAAALREELARQPSRERLETLAGLAGQTGSEALEDEVQRALILTGGGDPAMRRRAGFAAWRQGDAVLAERLLSEHARATGGDAESLFLLGEMRLRQRDADGARRWHEAALRRIGNVETRSADARKMHATLLRRLGAGERAVPIYEALLAERPDDRHLRADLVSLLIEMRDFGRAQTVLAGR